MARKTHGSLARGLGEARAITGLGGPELVCRLSLQEWGSGCKQGRGEVSETEGTGGGGQEGGDQGHQESCSTQEGCCEKKSFIFTFL